MRPSTKFSRPNRDAEIRRLRARAREAEASVAAARAEADRAILRMSRRSQAEITQAREQVAEVYRALDVDAARRRNEKDARAAYLEGPEWERDLLVLARDRVRAELMALSLTHESCDKCGSFGRGFMRNFLDAAIRKLTETHALAPAPKLPDPDWPVRMGARVRNAKVLDRRWLDAPETKAKEADGPRVGVVRF